MAEARKPHTPRPSAPAKSSGSAKSSGAAKTSASSAPAKSVGPSKSTALAQGRLDGDGVLVADVAQANRLHNKAVAGAPQAGNTLRLSRVEAAYCVAMGWLDVAGQAGPLAFGDLIAAGDHRLEVDYLVYRDLRERGLVARHAPGSGHFDVWPRGTNQGAPEYQVVACADTDPAMGSDFLDGANGLVCCVVDADSTVTHYKVEAADPRGDLQAQTLPSANGRVLVDRVLVEDAAACAAYAKQGFGTQHGDARLLSLAEAAHLVAQGVLHPDDPAAFKGAFRRHPDQALLGQVEAALRTRGLVAKSGLRFGTHLRAYSGDPDADHAPWLIHCAMPGDNLGWSSVARGVRLAHGVRKQFLLAVATPGEVRFVRLSWFRP